MRAFNLEQFHRVGQIYTGKSAVYYFNNKKMQCKINVSDHVVAMRSICNRVGVLTGRGTVLVFDLETVSAKNVEEKILNVHNSLEIKANAEDQITVLEWLKTHSTGSEVFLAVGTLMGHLYIFRIAGK
jgi:aspartate-semialdehyde dehydrogenase